VSKAPMDLIIEYCGPLERTFIMQRFITAHSSFWAKHHIRHPDAEIQVPEVVRCGHYNERHCAEYIDPHTCGDEVVHVAPWFFTL
jgi:hypothetical protein